MKVFENVHVNKLNIGLSNAITNSSQLISFSGEQNGYNIPELIPVPEVNF